MTVTIDSLDALKDQVGRQIAVTDWLPVTQERIQQFAEATGDHQWIHVDEDRARRESPYKTTIAHGFLTLSLVSQFMQQAMEFRTRPRMAINYGLNRVRFVAPVRSGMKIRALITLQSIKDLPEGIEAAYAITVEGEGGEKPCCVAEWVVRYYR